MSLSTVVNVVGMVLATLALFITVLAIWPIPSWAVLLHSRERGQFRDAVRLARGWRRHFARLVDPHVSDVGEKRRARLLRIAAPTAGTLIAVFTMPHDVRSQTPARYFERFIEVGDQYLGFYSARLLGATRSGRVQIEIVPQDLAKEVRYVETN